tara:strand:+ start:2951 stop:3280 length:330 start_codon:yes stop_codon:yes gene_type:complete
MRHSITIFGLIVLIIFIGCGSDNKTITVNTPTIQCGMCQKTIENGLKKVPGVIAADVDLKTKKATVSYDIEKMDIEKIEKVISSLGYKANETLADPDVYKELPGCCKVG